MIMNSRYIYCQCQYIYYYDVIQGVCQEGEELLHRDLDLLQVLYLRLAAPSAALSTQWRHSLLL